MSQNVTTDLGAAQGLFRKLEFRKALNGQKFTMPELSLNSSMFSWVTEDDSACLVCQEKSENIYTFAEAINLQPAHPNCRCKIVPLVGIKETTLTSIAPNYLLQKNSGETSSIRDKLYNKINLYAFEYDNADGKLPCEIERRWVAYPVGETNNCFAIISDDKLSFLTMDNFKSFFAITENGESTSFGKSIMNPQKELELLQNGEIAPMAYTYVMRLVYDWYGRQHCQALNHNLYGLFLRHKHQKASTIFPISSAFFCTYDEKISS